MCAGPLTQSWHQTKHTQKDYVVPRHARLYDDHYTTYRAAGDADGREYPLAAETQARVPFLI
jgi:hypothetical protein